MNTTMADPPGKCAAHATNPTTKAATQLDAVRAEVIVTSNMNTTTAQANAAQSSIIGATAFEDALDAADDATLTVQPDAATIASSAATLIGQDATSAILQHSTTPSPASTKSSLFADLPGELKNRIYRAYFEDFRQQKESNVDIKKTAPPYLNLLHTDRMIRSEASSIFLKEHLCSDSFFRSMDIEGAMKSRIESICALVAIHDIHLPISITVREILTEQDLFLREIVPFARGYSIVRRDFVDKLVQFIAGETHESFVCNASSNKSEEGRHHAPSHDKTSGSKVHVNYRYRVEHGKSYDVSQKRYAQLRPWAVNSSDFLRVVGPLAELDWRRFKWSFV